MKVFINPGHDPNAPIPDPGAVNQYNGLRECDVAEKCAQLLEKYLTAAGVEVVGNYRNDNLGKVVRAANASGADLFVSIHCNSADSDQAHGTETFCYYRSSAGHDLAQCIQSQIVNSLNTTDRGVKNAEPGKNGLYVLTYTDMIAVLVELAFISNSEDVILLQNNVEDFAKAIARGVTDYELMR